MLLDTGPLGCFNHSRPDDLFGNGHISPPIVHHTWEQEGLGLHPAPVLSQSLQKLGSQQNIAIAAALALMDMNDHAFTVDVGDLQVTQLGSSQPGCIQRHQHRTMHQVPRRINQPCNLIRTEYCRHPGALGERNLIEQVRKVTAHGLRLVFGQIAGFAINVYGAKPKSLVDLIQKDIVETFVDWATNERGHKGVTLQSRLGSVAAVMCHRREYADHDFTWMKSLIDGIDTEDESERKQRKAEKYLDYDVLETIPDKIRAARQAYAKRKPRNAKRIARMAMEELMFRWLLELPWRQRNLRECRICGSSPNLFKGRIAPYSELDRPEWVAEEEAKNPNAEFWQINFSAKETKTRLAIHLLLPRRLIKPLEEYLELYRPVLLGGMSTETLLLNQNGKPVRADLIDKMIGHWSLQFAGLRTTPHLFRDSVAYAWLKAHPKDYLNLAKLLWHRNVQTTINIYGARFNESSGVCAMEAWLDQREAEHKAN